ncbi:MAG TPA: hypothetical protein DER07_04530 [Armatimonadetes bacterium]|nr:hypothetical protein [Armatimonadota bacterium]
MNRNAVRAGRGALPRFLERLDRRSSRSSDSSRSGAMGMETRQLPAGFKPLVGTEDTTIDKMGRVLIPKAKRDRLGEDCAITLGTNGCVVILPEWHWIELQKWLYLVPKENAGAEEYKRLVFGEAQDSLRFDAQGRLVIPQRLRELARLKQKVKLVGAFDRVEVWDEDEYRQFLENPDEYGKERRLRLERALRLMQGAPA